METVKNNKLIAEFMGGKLGKFNISNLPYYSKLTFGYRIMPEELKYHSSWDWIMPVVEKIEKLPSEIRGIYFWATDKESEEEKNASQKNDFTIFRVPDILDLHNQVSAFIKWYNTQSLTA